MALLIYFVNDRTGSDEIANYRVRVMINQREIAVGRVIGHTRRDDWTALLRKFLEQRETEIPKL